MSPSSQMGQMGQMPKPAEAAKTAFVELVPPHAGVSTRPMFGNQAAFVNGNMFAGLFGDRLFVRLSDTDRTTLMQEGGFDFEPMPGRAMKGYTVLPDGWIADTEGSARWVEAAFRFTVALPVKEKKPKKGAR